MPIQETAPEPIREMLRSIEGGTFSFACHPRVPCFTECCRELRLLLTPYDIMRLKNMLDLGSRAFLDQYTESFFDEQRGLPLIYLKMQEDERETCPFVTSAGCRVYQDRPAACRIYPLARASRMDRMHGTILQDYFTLHETHCRGFEENHPWTADEWIQAQGLEPYHYYNDLWMEIITHPRLRGITSLTAQQQQIFFLAGYNLDGFRDLVLQNHFLRLFDIPDDEQKAVLTSDEALLRLAFKWLRFSLLNEPTLKVRN